MKQFKTKNYTLEQLKELDCKITELDGGIIAELSNDGFWYEFGIMEYSSDGYSCFWTIGGPAGELREARHSYFAQPANSWDTDQTATDGYIFYINGKLMTQAFKYLSKFYDDMV
jgi:hypothetical protein